MIIFCEEKHFADVVNLLLQQSCWRLSPFAPVPLHRGNCGDFLWRGFAHTRVFYSVFARVFHPVFGLAFRSMFKGFSGAVFAACVESGNGLWESFLTV